MEETDKQTGKSLVDSEQLYQLLFELLADEVHIWKLVRDESGAIKTWRLVDVNPVALKGWGRSRDDVVGKTTNEIFTNTDAVEQFMPIVQKIFSDGSPYHWEAYFAGTGQQMDMTSFPAGDYFITTGVDITERKRAEAMLRESEVRRAFLVHLADTLRPFTKPTAIAAAIARMLGEHLAAERVWLVLFHDDGTATVKCDYAANGATSAAGLYNGDDFATLTASLHGAQTLVVRDATVDDRFSEYQPYPVVDLPYKAFIATPIFMADRLVAMLVVGEMTARDWTGAEVRLVEEATKRAWPDLQRAQAEQALRESAERQAFLLKLSDMVRSITDSVAIEEIITRETMAFFNADRCFYSEISRDTALTRRDAARKDLPSVVGEYPLSELPVFKAAVELGRPLVVQNATTTNMLDESLRQLCLQLQIISFIDVPVIKDGEPVGFLSITQDTPRVWTDDEVGLAVEIAERTWTAVERGSAEEALQEMNEELEQLVAERTAKLLASNESLALEIAQRKKAEESLQRSEAHLEEAQRIAHVGSWEWLAATDAPTWSKELYRMLEIDPEEPAPSMADQAFLYTPKSFKRMTKSVAHTMRTGAPYKVELEGKKRDGSLRWLLSRGELWHDEQGQLIGMRGTAMDITERKQAEEALRQSKQSLEDTLLALKETQEQMLHQERLAAVGQLTAGIAHDFNNILTSILSFAQVLQLAPTMPASLQPKLEMIVNSGQQASQLVRQLLDFSQKTVRRPQLFELKGLLSEQSAFLMRTIPENIEIMLDIAPGDYPIEADATQLQQVITNLAVNARDAMPGGGKLELSLARLETSGQENCALCNEPVTGMWLGLTIRDSGSGIDAEAQHHIFEPFFTTKEKGQGTGLGLAQVAGIVMQHNGHITVNSRVGRGTVFTVYLPAALTQQVVAPEEAPALVQAGRGQTVLLVEDKPLVIEAIKAILEEMDCRVLTAVNGREALTVYAEHQAEIAVVLSDMVMPDMDGEALFQVLKAETPDLNMVLMSGYPLDDRGAALLKQGLVAWLNKPFSLEELSQVLDKALARGTEPSR